MRRRRSRGGSRSQPAFTQVARVGEPGGLAGDDPDAGAAIPTAGDLLDPPVVEARRRRALVLGVDLGEVAARPHRGSEHALQNIVVDHGVQATDVPCAWFGPSVAFPV